MKQLSKLAALAEAKAVKVEVSPFESLWNKLTKTSSKRAYTVLFNGVKDGSIDATLFADILDNAQTDFKN